MKEVKILEVHVDKGMKHGQKITFGGEADQAPGVEPGDIVLVLQEKDHEVGRPFHQQPKSELSFYGKDFLKRSNAKNPRLCFFGVEI